MIMGIMASSAPRPTILADVPPGARIHSEETFGPVLVAQPVDDADEAIAVANATSYGLSAGLITGDNQRGFALARRIDAGAVHVDDQTIADEPQLPLGGVKDSGWGRSGPESMADFTEVQWITTRDGAAGQCLTAQNLLAGRPITMGTGNRATTTGQIWWDLPGVGSAAGPNFEIFPWPVDFTYGNCVAASNLSGNNNTRLVMEPCDGSTGRVFRLG